jgi:GTP pyrophosphokinase
VSTLEDAGHAADAAAAVAMRPAAPDAPEEATPAPRADTRPPGTLPPAERRESPGQASGGGWRLGRLARFTSPRPTVNHLIDPLLAGMRAADPKADTTLVERAFEVADRAHQGQIRKSGQPYITHPVAVATILAELGMPSEVLAAALLHDVVEDTTYGLDTLRGEFGDEIAQLVDGVTKLDKVTYGDAAQAETVRKMIVAMARDIRVLVIKLADRLHNARTWRYVSPESAERKARETLEIYAPLAHRLGMNTVKWELEDLAFATLYPKVYDEIVRLVADRAPAREEYLESVREQVVADLRSAKIKAAVTGRPKHYYSVYQKMIVRGRDFADIYDLVGLRVLVDSVRDCYAVLGTLHARWNPVPGRFKDYIAMPKFNMYQSLHTTVVGPNGKPVEIQIRTAEMHRRAEYGVAAHWKYKDGAGKGVAKAAHKGAQPGSDLSWLRQLLDWQSEASDPSEFLDGLRFEVSAAEVFVFTPKGDVMSLPAGATPVDFAYAIHTEVGHRCMGARVNGRLVPLDRTLDNGDVVEIFTSKAAGAGPSRDWLEIVASPRARNKIKQWFSKERREEAVDAGRESIARSLRKQNLPVQRLLTHETLLGIANDLRYADVSALYAAVGEHQVSAHSVVHRLVALLGGEAGAEEDLAEVATPTRTESRPRIGDAGVVVRGDPDVWTKLARCCLPVPGDEIIGFVTKGQGVSVHRADCPNVGSLRREPERFLPVEWAPNSSSVFLVQIQVEALDRKRLLSDVTKTLSDSHVNILSAAVSTREDRVALSRFTFEMGDTQHLDHLLAQVRRVEGVFDAYRVTAGMARMAG